VRGESPEPRLDCSFTSYITPPLSKKSILNCLFRHFDVFNEITEEEEHSKPKEKSDAPKAHRSLSNENVLVKKSHYDGLITKERILPYRREKTSLRLGVLS